MIVRWNALSCIPNGSMFVGAPANSKTPLEIVKQAQKIASDYQMEIEVLGEVS